MTGVVHEDVLLTDGYYGGETEFRTMHFFRISMNHVAGVEVLEARNELRRLVTRVSAR